VEDLHCISYCNDVFLKELPQISKYARTTTFVNCMTFAFPAEVQMVKVGHIDFELYQTSHGMERCQKKLRPFAAGHARPILHNPYFKPDEFPYHEDRPDDKFRFGRISRADLGKFSKTQMWIYETMTAPVLKEGIILGWDERIGKKIGRAPSYITTLEPGGMSQQEFYKFCEAIIQAEDCQENLPRVGMEAMASGSVLVVDKRPGWQALVEDGVTGWLCRDNREFVYKSCRCAYDVEGRKRMARAARAKLEAEWGFEAAARSWEEVFKTWEKTPTRRCRASVSLMVEQACSVRP
jgi:hypothetical protein